MVKENRDVEEGDDVNYNEIIYEQKISFLETKLEKVIKEKGELEKQMSESAEKYESNKFLDYEIMMNTVEKKCEAKYSEMIKVLRTCVSDLMDENTVLREEVNELKLRGSVKNILLDDTQQYFEEIRQFFRAIR